MSRDTVANILQHLRLALRAVFVGIQNRVFNFRLDADCRFDLITHEIHVTNGIQNLNYFDLPVKLRRFAVYGRQDPPYG